MAGLSSLPLGLLRFCMMHTDSPPEGSAPVIPPRPKADYEWLREALDDLRSDTDRMKLLLKEIAKAANVPLSASGGASAPALSAGAGAKPLLLTAGPANGTASNSSPPPAPPTETPPKAAEAPGNAPIPLSDAAAARIGTGLEELVTYVEDIDNARDLHKVGGVEVVAALLSARYPIPIRVGALEVIAASAHNNSPVQLQWIEAGVLPVLLAMLHVDGSSLLLHRTVSALSALSSHNAHVRTRVFERADVAALIAAASRSQSPAARVRVLVFLRTLLLDDAEGDATARRLSAMADWDELWEPLCAMALDPAPSADRVREVGQELLALLSSSPPIAAHLARLQLPALARARADALVAREPKPDVDRTELLAEVARLGRLAG